MLSPTAERVVPREFDSEDARLMYLRHVFAYEEAAKRLTGCDRVLDIGCGEGYGTARLTRSVRMACGIDVDPETIAHANATHGSATCEYLTYGGARLPFGDQSFAAAVSCQVIEHVADDSGFVAEAARVLRPGGTLIVTTPNRLLRLKADERPWNRYHVREYAPETLKRLLGSHFEQVDILGIHGDASTHAHELERLAWIRRTVERDPMALRRFLSERVKRHLLGFLRGRKGRPSISSETSESYMYQLITAAESSLDLFAVCYR